MMVRKWVRFVVLLSDGDEGDGVEADWVMLFMNVLETNVPDCTKCKK